MTNNLMPKPKKDFPPVEILLNCLFQKINYDKMIDDTGREWWYVSSLYAEGQVFPDIPDEELVERLERLSKGGIPSIKEVNLFSTFQRPIIQVRGDRKQIIAECKKYLDYGNSKTPKG